MGMTLDNVRRMKCRLTAYCTRDRTGTGEAPHSGPVDLDMLIERFGTEADVYGRAIQRAMRCKECAAPGAEWRSR